MTLTDAPFPRGPGGDGAVWDAAVTREIVAFEAWAGGGRNSKATC